MPSGTDRTAAALNRAGGRRRGGDVSTRAKTNRFDSPTADMADSLWGLCADDPFAGEWNQSCTYWTVIYAGAPAALFLTCTLINVSTLLAFPAVRHGSVTRRLCDIALHFPTEHSLTF